MASSRIKTLIGILLVILITTFFNFTGFLKPIESSIRRVINFGSSIMYSTTARIDDSYFSVKITTSTSQIGSSISQDEYLSCKRATTEVELLQDENAELRAQLNFFSRVQYRHIGAEVIGRDIEPIGNTIMINRGFKDGIVKGQPVIISDGTLVGKIARTESDMAIVQLINDGESKVAATIINENRSLGIVEGGYGLSVRMSFIPQNETIKIGDTIVTSGLEEKVPSGLIIGTIEAVEKEAYQPFQRAILDPMAPLDKLKHVSIIISKPTSSTPL